MANYNQNVEPYLNENGDVGVLYSPGYGAGWASWNTNEYAYDKRIVEKFIEDPDMFHTYKGSLFRKDDQIPKLHLFMEELGYDGYYGGAQDLKLVFIPRGTMFRITEYDGFEGIEVFDPSDYISF